MNEYDNKQIYLTNEQPLIVLRHIRIMDTSRSFAPKAGNKHVSQEDIGVFQDVYRTSFLYLNSKI